MARSSANSLLQRELLDTIKGLRTTIESLNSTIEDLRKALAESQTREKNLQEQIETMTKRLYGRSSEKHMVQSEGQLDFFNEVELEADKQPEEEFPYVYEPEESAEKEEKKRKPRTSRKDMFKGITVVDEPPVELPEEKQYCSECGTKLIPMAPRLVREVLKYIPAKLELHRIYVQTYYCPKCKENGDKSMIVTAEAPDALIPHSYASESVAVHSMYQKFVNAVPLYRQERTGSRWGPS